MEMKKERFIKILKRVLIGLSIGLNVFFLIAMIIGGASVKKQSNKLNKVDNVSEKVEFKQENKRLVSYDDDDYTIYLSGEETQYSYEHFYNYIVDNSLQWNDIKFYANFGDYTNVEYIFSNDSAGDGYLYFESTDPVLAGAFVYNNELFFNTIGNELINGRSPYYFFDYENEIYFEHIDLVVLGNGLSQGALDNLYNDIKQAIELDIQANNGTINDGIFETLTESTVSFIGTLGSGIVAMTSVFYDSANSQLTTIGLLSVIVVAVSLSYFLFRLIIGLIRMRG